MSVEPSIQFFSLQGIACAGCVKSVDRALSNLQKEQPSIASYSINFADRTAVISGECDPQHVLQAIEKAGYNASIITENHSDDESASQQHFRLTLINSFIALFVGGVMMTLQMLELMAPLSSSQGITQSFILALSSAGVMYFCAKKIYIGAWTSLKNNALNMDILIALGTLSAWVYSLILLVLLIIDPRSVPAMAQHVYFESAVMILGFILLGQALETKVRGNTLKAVKSLMKLQPKTAWKINDRGEIEEVAAALLLPGDKVMIKPGEAIPVDATVIAGSSSVDESLLSGESLAVLKNAGDSLVGSTLNGNGSLTAEVTQVGSKTVLSQIIRQVKQAQNSKPAIGRLADEIAAVFVPAVLLIALITAISWWYFAPAGYWSYILVTTMSVLIIACPCALGLATPMSTMVGVGLAANRGILIQNGDALQVAEKLTTVVLDKTGTITQGHPIVTSESWLNDTDTQLNMQGTSSSGLTKIQLLSWIEALEERSEHPLATAVVAFSHEKLAEQHHVAMVKPEIDDFKNHIGLGVSATIDNRQVRIGSVSWFEGGFSAAQTALVNQWMDSGQTVVVVEVDHCFSLFLGIVDPIKADSEAAIKKLQQKGLEVVMLSGDRERTALAVAKSVGITQCRGGLSASEKQQAIEQMQQQGKVVAMVGDGVNDAPALAVANLGCAMGTGTDVAINSSDITLINGSLLAFVQALKVARLTLNNIKQNLFAAFIYNIVAIPVAAGVLYPVMGVLLNPMFAGVAMALSSVTVVCNAYRLSFNLK